MMQVVKYWYKDMDNPCTLENVKQAYVEQGLLMLRLSDNEFMGINISNISFFTVTGEPEED